MCFAKGKWWLKHGETFHLQHQLTLTLYPCYFMSSYLMVGLCLLHWLRGRWDLLCLSLNLAVEMGKPDFEFAHGNQQSALWGRIHLYSWTRALGSECCGDLASSCRPLMPSTQVIFILSSLPSHPSPPDLNPGPHTRWEPFLPLAASPASQPSYILETETHYISWTDFDVIL